MKSKVMLGSIGPISRARVMELWSDDADHGPTPAQRALGAEVNAFRSHAVSRCFVHEDQSRFMYALQVQQRGVAGTLEILDSLMEGVEVAADAPIFCIDLVPNQCLVFKGLMVLLRIQCCLIFGMKSSYPLSSKVQ